jgi:hypothetical protein
MMILARRYAGVAFPAKKNTRGVTGSFGLARRRWLLRPLLDQADARRAAGVGGIARADVVEQTAVDLEDDLRRDAAR